MVRSLLFELIIEKEREREMCACALNGFIAQTPSSQSESSIQTDHGIILFNHRT